MIWHLGARLHRSLYSWLYRSDHKDAIRLHQRIRELMRDNAVGTAAERKALIAGIVDAVAKALGLEGRRRDDVEVFVTKLFEYESLFDPPEPDFNTYRTVSEVWRLRESLAWHKRQFDHFDDVVDAIADFTHACFRIIEDTSAIPTPADRDGVWVTAPRFASVDGLGQVVESIMRAAYSSDIERFDQLPRLRQRLEMNLVSASGGNPRDLVGFNRPYRPASKHDARKPRDLLEAYLNATPLLELFEGETPIIIPTATRYEHHHIIAGSGHGKTQTLQYLISTDLEAVAKGERSVVVIDSQGDLIRKIANLRYFASGQPLQNRICIIDPTDIEWPVSLNLFDVGLERLRNYPMLERERLTNSILELYDFVLGSLLSAEMTQKQNVIFRYVTRLMLHIPDATIHTLRELMEKGSEVRFAEHIVKLEGTARHFFETEFPSKEFAQTRQQVLRRLWGILENQTFERMFSHPRSKLDLFAEMNAGKVILINTAKDLLKESGTEIFGRFFVAMIAQAAQERAVLPESRRMPTLVYVDEAADYFDRNISVILSQARKYKVGMVLAHQYLGQLDPKLQEAFSANTAIKFAGGFTGREARSAAQMLNCDPALIESQPKGSFAAFIRGVTPSAIPLKFPFGKLEELPTMTSGEKADLHDRMRDKYAVHFTELRKARAGNGSGDRQEDGGGRAYREDDSDSGSHNSARPRRGGNASRNANDDDPDNPDTSPGPKW